MLENLLAARAAGAEILTYHEVTGIDIEDGAIRAVSARNTITGEQIEIEARSVVNAAGPWVDRVLATTGKRAPRHIGGTKGSHIVVGDFEGAPKDAFYVEAAKDARPFFIIPWNGQYLIGTTDIRFEGDLSEIRASREEVDYLLAETNRVFPEAHLGADEIHYAYAGVRPLPYREKGPESAITRKHIIKDNRAVARGLVSIIGGKLTTYRRLAQQTVDRLARILRRRLPDCRTEETLLPGAYRLDEARSTLESLEELSPAGVERLIAIYGGRAIGLVSTARAEPPLERTIDAGRTILAAEVAFAIREEMALTLTDIVFRRLMTGFDADQGRPLYEVIAAIAANEFGWTDTERYAQLEALYAYSDSLLVQNEAQGE